MSSGVEPADECITTYQELKLGKKFRYVLFGLNEANTQIVVRKTSHATDYDDFLSDLPRDQCRWAIYDFEFDKGNNGKRNKIGLLSWSPDDATVKEKMVFASSREALRRKLEGIAFEIQGTDLSEINHRAVLDKALTSTH